MNISESIFNAINQFYEFNGKMPERIEITSNTFAKLKEEFRDELLMAAEKRFNNQEIYGVKIVINDIGIS